MPIITNNTTPLGIVFNLKVVKRHINLNLHRFFLIMRFRKSELHIVLYKNLKKFTFHPRDFFLQVSL